MKDDRKPCRGTPALDPPMTPTMNSRRPRSAVRALVLACGAAMAAFALARAQKDEEASAAVAGDRVVLMQRFVVSATRIETNPWRHGSVPGFEVLTRASEHDTNWRIDALRRGMWIEGKVMPRDWLPDSAVPYTIILDDTDLREVPADQIHMKPTVLSSPADAFTWGILSDNTNLSIETVGSSDSDTVAINNNLYGVDTAALMDSTISLERLARCTPPLPPWLIAGLTGRTSGVFREAFGLLADTSNGVLDRPGPVRRAAGPGTLWVSLAETQRMLKLLWHNSHDPSFTVPPLRLMFAKATPPAERLALWESEAALFVRWGLMGADGPDPANRSAFLEFVRRAQRAPVTEEMFVDCFGCGYEAMEVKLAAFLRKVLAKPTFVAWDMPAGVQEPVNLSEATSDQIGRILGDWLRMQGDYLQNTDPEMSDRFLGLAGRMLERAYREDNGLPPDVDVPRGEHAAPSSQSSTLGPAVAMKPFVVTAERIHDPRLLAVYGLYEHDTGNDAKARELLEAAAKSGAVRPRAYVVLAQLRYAEAIGKPLGAEGKLGAEQAASVLGPLKTALAGAPTPDIYDLIVETWTNSETKPAEGDIEGLRGGVERYPADTDLAYNAAQLCSQSGQAAQASWFIDKGLVFATHEINREYFEQLRSTLSSAPTR